MLAMLECILIMDLEGMTTTGIRAIAYALIKGCPQLDRIYLMTSTLDSPLISDVVEGMLEASRRSKQVNAIL